MGIPQLTSCCCGCTLNTGTKIIGWLALIGAVLMLVMSYFGLTSLDYIVDQPVQTPQSQFILDHLPAMKFFMVFAIVLYVLKSIFACMLLLGTYQKKAKLFLYWVVFACVVALVELGLNLVVAIEFAEPAKLIYTPGLLIDLYFMLVVYSFYREIKDVSDYA